MFFENPPAFRRWLSRNHARERELWVGFFKKATGKKSITYPEALDEGLCFGWIDGLKKTVDEESYAIRFTPRRKGSNWSRANIKRVGELTKLGLMAPPGLTAFKERTPETTEVDRRSIRPDPAILKELRADPQAWAFFEKQPESYRHIAVLWVMTARKEETRRRRLAALVDDSANGRRIKPMRRSG